MGISMVMGVPQQLDDFFGGTLSIKIDDGWGYCYFRKPPYYEPVSCGYGSNLGSANQRSDLYSTSFTRLTSPSFRSLPPVIFCDCFPWLKYVEAVEAAGWIDSPLKTQLQWANDGTYPRVTLEDQALALSTGWVSTGRIRSPPLSHIGPTKCYLLMALMDVDSILMFVGKF